MANLRLRRWHYIVGVLLIASVVLIAVWNWDWFIPPLTRMTAAKLGRPVQIEHLHLRIARNPVLEADGVVIGNPSGFPAPGPFARIERLGVMVNGPAWLHSQAVLVPSIEMENPVVDAIALPDGRNNWTFPFNATPPGTRPGSGARIGNLRITGGHIHVVDPKLRADFHLDIATREAAEGHPAQLVIEATGQYAGQPITGRFVGGALLTLRDRTNPYPIDLRLANGTTHVALQGTVQDPLVFAGTNLKVEFSGESLANLMPLTGVPAPGTPPFRLTGEVNYVEQRLRLENLVGQLGSSDIEGNITVDPGTERPRVTVELHSRRVDLADLGGFIGTTPGRVTTPGQTPAKRREVARAEAGPYLIPHVIEATASRVGPSRSTTWSPILRWRTVCCACARSASVWATAGSAAISPRARLARTPCTRAPMWTFAKWTWRTCSPRRIPSAEAARSGVMPRWRAPAARWPAFSARATGN
jgi:uncharacterized protein involved in outer membrane biogenesis